MQRRQFLFLFFFQMSSMVMFRECNVADCYDKPESSVFICVSLFLDRDDILALSLDIWLFKTETLLLVNSLQYEAKYKGCYTKAGKHDEWRGVVV